MVCDDSPGEVLLNMSHPASRVQWKVSHYFFLDPVGSTVECICTRNVCIIPMKMGFRAYSCQSFSIRGCGLKVVSGARRRAATSNTGALMNLTGVISITGHFAVIAIDSVVSLLAAGHQGAAAELLERLAKNPKPDMMDKLAVRRRRDKTAIKTCL